MSVTSPATQQIVADLSGAVINGQVAIGEHIVQIHAEHGAVVNYAAPQQQPLPRLRGAPVRRLPRDFAQLVGREREVAEASTQTAAGVCVEFHGPPGIGKTALLRHLAHRLDDGARPAVLFAWCGRQPVADLQQFVFECLYECDGPVVLTPASAATYLQDQRALIVLDDVELDRSELDRLMDTLPAAVFVCASPARRLWGEGHTVELAGLGPDGAVALIERELGRTLDAQERATAGRLCATLRGHPLAILRAATRLDPSGRLREPAAVAAPAGGPLVELLAELPGVPVPTVDIAAVSGDACAAVTLAALEASHVVQSHSPRYSLRAGTPVAAGHGGNWRERLLNHFVADGGAAGDAGRAERAQLAAPPVLAVLAWAAEARRPADVLALARATDGLLALGARWGAWGAALEHALRAARSCDRPADEAWALHQLGSRALCLGDLAGARTMLTDALELRERLGDERGAALTRHNLSLLDGGPPPPGRGRPRWPRPPILALVLALTAIMLLTAMTIAIAVPGRDDPAPSPSPSPSPSGGASPGQADKQQGGSGVDKGSSSPDGPSRGGGAVPGDGGGSDKTGGSCLDDDSCDVQPSCQDDDSCTDQPCEETGSCDEQPSCDATRSCEQQPTPCQQTATCEARPSSCEETNSCGKTSAPTAPPPPAPRPPPPPPPPNGPIVK